MHSIHISIWNAKTKSLTTIAVDKEEAVEELASQLAQQFSAELFVVPGFELTSDNENWGQLAVAVAPFGWALIHTSQDYATQHCTFGTKHSSDQKTVDVQWDEVTSIPSRWFIDKSQALDGIRQWMRTGKLADGLPWSTDCY